MTDEQVKKYIDMAVRRSVEEYKRAGLLEMSSNAIYGDAVDILAGYYRNGKKDAGVTYALEALRFDPYFRIIPLYFEEHRTHEDIAGIFGVDVSTVSRNKKRLCLAVYNEIQQ
jgi:hypothetical protein